VLARRNAIAVATIVACVACGWCLHGTQQRAPMSSGARRDRAESLARDLRSGDRWTRLRAAGDLRVLGVDAEPAIPGLLHALGDPYIDVRAQAAGALVRLGETEHAQPVLVECLRAESSTVRSGASADLGWVPELSPEALLGLIRSLSDLDATVRANAAATLGEKAACEAESALLQCLRDPETQVRINAAGALGSIAGVLGRTSDAAAQGLVALLDDPQAAVRATAADSLRVPTSDPSEQVKQLASLLDDPSPSVRISGALSIALLGEPQRALPTLVESLSDEDWVVRYSAVTSLGLIGRGASDALPQVQPLLDDPSPAVAGAARTTSRLLAGD